MRMDHRTVGDGDDLVSGSAGYTTRLEEAAGDASRSW